MKSKISHISFDLWLTLLKSNPEFKRKKIGLFWKDYNPKKLSLEEIEAIVRNVDVQCTRIAEITQTHFNTFSMISMILFQLGNNDHQLGDIQAIHNKIQWLYLENLPFLYEEQTKSILEKLYYQVNILSVGSNTGFVDGETIRKGLDFLGIGKFFDDFVFSNECGFAKPSKDFFKLVHDVSRYDKEQILHVGDNSYADGYGAKLYGLESFIINSNDKSISNVLTLVNRRNK